ncbi:splicing coactivator subunit srm300-like protein [Naegleria gruberi]|uniref:Splicing coactivator subunit srm300-like protein n=1 Tax=Naegleria gruberi TaxID=5762 RepID=D2VJD0_NAEGR|nr:splicing coactivator subunit srm300-like protein [Naegleria gruberi]EFC42923.1 splicing coactivator subunit srm300-like protein [Naegleria gruberi]|eukprot:XP_002675667.1 splicing coactivator subunit srm300-like protein [Naegleria gruberi strain NEG-M]
MYNGIGLTTPRGSGTNGYVQTNYSSVKNKKPNNNYQQKERKDLLKIKSPNVDLLIHEEKKKVEIELYKLKSELTKQGKLTPEEIDQQISDKRKERMKLIENKYNNINNKGDSKTEENNERNEKFKKALSLDKEFEKKGIKSNEDAELVAFDSKLNEMLKRKEKPASLEKKQRKKKRRHDRNSSSDSSSESASSSDSDE